MHENCDNYRSSATRKTIKNDGILFSERILPKIGFCSVVDFEFVQTSSVKKLAIFEVYIILK